ncbi:S8 family peptidase [Roseovarius sp. Pro17]|uniref:S8 family peptidase n=1 Tax=Roseovarius sp. Pro17 TaxID=3108175 RepID=UPI002D77A43C|nr:S8 family serine peptidase [Roseovarius sp. Pro17]
MRSVAMAMVLALGATEIAAQSAVPELVLEWRSKGENAAELSTEMETFYLSLFNSGNLTLRKIKMDKSPFAERVLRDEKLFFGAYFPQSIDAMMCDLNPHLCRRDRNAASERQLRSLTSHVAGYVISQGRWRTKLGDTITVPDYNFRTITTLTRQQVPSDWDVSQFTVSAQMDCSAFKGSCDDVIARFNPPIINAPGGMRSVTLPQLQLQTAVTLRTDPQSKLVRSLVGSLVTSDRSKVFVDPTAIFAPAWQKQFASISLNDLALKILQPNLRTTGSVKDYGLSDEPLVADQIDLFKLIHHPFANMEELSEQHRHPVDVVIIDSAVTQGHCDLPSLILGDGEVLDPPETEEGVASDVDADTTVVPASTVAETQVECSEIDPLALSQSEHGAAVAGVIASPENGRGMVGINPYARLHMISFDKTLSRDRQIVRLAEQIMVDIPVGVRVANLSFGLLPDFQGNGEVENALRIYESRLLIVAAAGNEAKMLNNGCSLIPACLNALENVITVVGLNDSFENPAPWRTASQGSNTSPRFEIGAPAMNVLTTTSGNVFARMSGTSFAAPQVTAAASLIFSTGEFIYGDNPEVLQTGGQLAPKVVKDRLIYTADFFPGLNGQILAGRLNIERAINLQYAQFELFDGRRIVGQVVGGPDTIACRSPDPAEQFQSWWNIRRLTFNDAKDRHILFQHVGAGDGSRYSELDRNGSCLVATLSPMVDVRVTIDGVPEVVSFPFREIRDYTSPLFQG